MQGGTSARVLCGRYEVGETIGSGGMGEVYAGHDLRLDRDVALKILRPGFAADEAASEAARRRFETEARLAARIAHPNVVAVFDSGESEGTPFLVMERLPGTTLADAIARGPLAPSEVRAMGIEVLHALAAAHERGIAHRDVKPANILGTSDGHWKVADFGIAKRDAGGSGDDTATTTGLVYGTLSYLAPERIAGGPATVATDVYATGVVLYEALAARRPVLGGAPPSEYLAPSPPPLASLCPGLAPALVSVVEQAMAIDPSARFASATAMADALTRIDPIGAAGDTVAISTPPPETEPAGTVSAAAVPTAAVWVAASTGPAARRRPPLTVIAVAMGAVLVVVAVGVAFLLATRGGHSGASLPPPPPPPPSAATSEPAVTLTPGLEGSLQRLEQVIRR